VRMLVGVDECRGGANQVFEAVELALYLVRNRMERQTSREGARRERIGGREFPVPREVRHDGDLVSTQCEMETELKVRNAAHRVSGGRPFSPIDHERRCVHAPSLGEIDNRLGNRRRLP
jgi:hypothetical protein